MLEFKGYVESAIFSENCKITINEEGILAAGKFDLLQVPFGEISAIIHEGYKTRIHTANGDLTVSRMGQEQDWFWRKLWKAYNDAVVKALLVDGESIFAAEGEFQAKENDLSHQGPAVFQVYEDCLCILPPNDKARRLPFSFLANAKKSDFSITLYMATGEEYMITKLGRELNDLDRVLTQQMHALREKNLEWQKTLAPDMGSMQAAAAGKRMPMGRAADWKDLTAAAPPLIAAIEEKLQQSRMAETWPWFWDLCGGKGLLLGILPPPPKAESKESEEKKIPAMPPSEIQEKALSEEEQEPRPILWIIAPDKQGLLAAVELDLGDDEAAATYLYRIQGSWENFSAIVDRAMEATGFQREIILLPEEKLNSPAHLQEKMLVTRTPALQMLRKCFAGRAIHSSLDRWKKDIEKHF